MITDTSAPTISERLAQEARALSFEQLPAPVIHEAKRRVMDIMACAVGGFDSRPSRVMQEVAKELGGSAESTIVGSGFKTSCLNAALANGVMVRFTEAMDRGLTGPGGVQQSHPGEIIPAVLAVGERQHSSGRDVITAIVLGYELNRVSDAMGGGWHTQTWGWKPEIRAGLIVPLVIGRLLGLDETQMVNAVGVAASFLGELGIMDHAIEGRTMARNLRFPYAAYEGILSAFMAMKGLEGPRRIYEGRDGFNEIICGGQMDLARLLRRDDDFKILYTQAKIYPVNGRLQCQIDALIRLVTEHDLKPEMIDRVRITTPSRMVAHEGDPGSHRYPTTKEIADHSAYFTAALAIVDRDVRLSLDQFTPERLQDPQLRKIIDKVELIGIPETVLERSAQGLEWRDDQAPTTVEITTTDGRTFTAESQYPKGHFLNPLSDAELEGKFRTMAGASMSEAQLKRVFQAIYRLDELDDVSDLVRTLVFST